MSFSKKQFLGILLVVTIVAAGVGTGVAYVQLQPSPIAPGSGTLSDSVLTLESQELRYTGTNVTDVDVTINSSAASTTHTVDIHIALRNTSAGTVEREVTKQDVPIAPNGVVTKTVSFDEPIPTNEFDQLQVNVEQNGTD